MNRIILLGNGFDLAHGLKTSYKDFIIWYLKKAFKSAYADSTYQDDLMSINCPQPVPSRFGNILTLDELVDTFFVNGIAELLTETELSLPNYIRSIENPFHVDIHSDFMKKIITECHNAKWVDIENVFYTSLVENLKSGRPKWKLRLEQLLKAMHCLTELLTEYLQTQQLVKDISEIDELLASPIEKDDVATNFLKESKPPIRTMIVNFNYTSTVEHYLTRGNASNSDIEVNYIHGQLNDPKNPIIFGYGDEADQHYKEMEEWHHHGYFRYIKTFWYSRASNYFKLIRFVDSEPFQVYILGHSCGLSDRTMLSTIFEHLNCQSIKLFYHEQGTSNNFNYLIEDISLLFEDRKAMRQKVVPFTQSYAMPQLK